MSDKKYTLEEYVFRDLRKAYEFQSVMKKHGDSIDPIEMIKEYRKMSKSCDAEKWGYALASYRNYPCFYKNPKYVFKDSDNMFYEYLKEEEVRQIKISADTLTGPIGLMFYADKLIEDKSVNEVKKDELRSTLRDFCSVAYTIGNFCPVMKNKGGRPNKEGAVVSDSCWNKLNRFHNTKKNHIFQNFIDYDWKDNESKRCANNMFAVFPVNLSGRVIVDELMLNDYYDDDYNLIIKKTPQEYANLGVDAYIDFLRLVTSIIIKRGIRIYRKNDLRGINIDKLADKIITRKKAEISGKTEFDCKYSR